MMFRGLLVLALVSMIGCVTPNARVHAEPELVGFQDDEGLTPPPLVDAPGLEATPTEELGRQLAEIAARYVGLKSLKPVTKDVTDDCSGFVRLVYHGEGIELFQGGTQPGENGVSAIYRRALDTGAVHRTEPRPGDLVFFHDTYDRNRNGRRDDALTHIGVVESVDGEGTVTFIHRHGPGVTRSKLNLGFPTSRTGPDGRIFNDYLRRATRRDPAALAGELFSGYASPDRL